MGNDLPDYQTEVVSSTTEATSFRSGLDADKPASPAKGDIWLATDTTILYVCYSAGAWTNVGALYLLLAGGTMSGDIAMGSNLVTGLGAPTDDNDAARKTYVDSLLAGASQAEPSRSLDTVYQNTSGKVRLVTVSVLFGTNSSSSIGAYVENANPPTIRVARALQTAVVGLGTAMASTFVVPPSWRYEVATGGTVTLQEWIEWDLH